MSAVRHCLTLDTNILVYSVDRASGSRHQLAIQIIAAAARGDCLLTLQAVSEFYVVATRKGLIARNRAAMLVRHWLDVFPHTAASADAIRIALGDAASGRASYWDSLLIATAAEAGCTVILTEDLQDGTTLHGVEIHNPFDISNGLTERARRLLGL